MLDADEATRLGDRAKELIPKELIPGDEIGQILLRLGRIEPSALREALRTQSESGGQLGAVLRRMGACSASDAGTVRRAVNG